AGDERSALAAPQHHAFEPSSALDLTERRLQIAECRLVDHVHLAGGIVHHQMRDRALAPFDPEHRHQSRSSTNAAPWPPPTHNDAMPRWMPRRRISISSVSRSRAPLDPTGWPSAIAPPFT